jgi:hypothetical protein
VALADRGRVAVSDEEEVGKADDGRDPGTAGLTGKETLADINNVFDPENLAGDEEQGDHEQNEPFGVRDQECAKSKDQQQNDRAPMNDDALINCEETDHPALPVPRPMRCSKCRRCIDRTGRLPWQAATLKAVQSCCTCAG